MKLLGRYKKSGCTYRRRTPPPVDTFTGGKDSISLIVTALEGPVRPTRPITGKNNGRTLGDLGLTNQPLQPLPSGQLSYCRK